MCLTERVGCEGAPVLAHLLSVTKAPSIGIGFCDLNCSLHSLSNKLLFAQPHTLWLIGTLMLFVSNVLARCVALSIISRRLLAEN